MPLARTPNMLVVLDDHPNSDAGTTIARRYAPEHLTLAGWGRRSAEGTIGELSSVSAQPTVAEALKTAAQHEIAWITMRRDCLPPRELLGELLRGAADNRQAPVPGFAVILADGEPRPFQRILAIVDRGSGPISGLASYFAAAVAIQAGAKIDVLVIGAPDESELSPHFSADQLKVNREQELFDRGNEMTEEAGLEVTYITETGGDPWALIAEAVKANDYDLIVDDLGDVSLGRRHPDRRIEDALSEGKVGNLPLRLLTETDIPLMLVVDGVRLGLAPAGLMRLGSAAALSLGIATTTIIPASNAAALTVGHSAEPVDQLISGLQGGLDLTVAADEDTLVADREATIAQASRSTTKVTIPDGGASTKAVQKAKSKAAKSKAALASAKDEQAAAEKAVAKAEKKLAKARKTAAKLAEKLEETRDAMDAAETEAEDAASRSTGVRALLPGSIDKDEAAVIAELSTEAEDEFLQAVNEGGGALSDLQTAQLALDDAEFKLTTADTDVAEAKEDYAEDKATAEAYAESLADSRLVPMAKGSYKLTARYGDAGGRWSSGHHTGLDFAAPTGTAVRAAASGKVVETGYSGAYGNRVVIRHADGYETTYNHLSKISVAKGDTVTAGDSVGKVGSTGNSTGAHLHFEVMRNDKFIDPESWLGW